MYGSSLAALQMRRKVLLTCTEEVRRQYRISIVVMADDGIVDTYQFGYFLRKTEAHSVVIKVRVLRILVIDMMVY